MADIVKIYKDRADKENGGVERGVRWPRPWMIRTDHTDSLCIFAADDEIVCHLPTGGHKELIELGTFIISRAT